MPRKDIPMHLVEFCEQNPAKGMDLLEMCYSSFKRGHSINFDYLDKILRVPPGCYDQYKNNFGTFQVREFVGGLYESLFGKGMPIENPLFEPGSSYLSLIEECHLELHIRNYRGILI